MNILGVMMLGMLLVCETFLELKFWNAWDGGAGAMGRVDFYKRVKITGYESHRVGWMSHLKVNPWLRNFLNYYPLPYNMCPVSEYQV